MARRGILWPLAGMSGGRAGLVFLAQVETAVTAAQGKLAKFSSQSAGRALLVNQRVRAWLGLEGTLNLRAFPLLFLGNPGEIPGAPQPSPLGVQGDRVKTLQCFPLPPQFSLSCPEV